METTGFSIRYLRAAARRPAIRELKERSYEVMRVAPGASVIDIGCGPGIDTIQLGRRVGPTGSVLGIDADPEMIAAAQAAAAAAGVAGWTEHRVGTSRALPLDAGAVEACRCERLLQHLSRADALATVLEALRVLRPGGRIVFVDTDWPSLSVHASDPTVERRMVLSTVLGWRNAFAARGFPELFVQSGVSTVEFETRSIPLAFEEVQMLLGVSARRAVMAGWVSWYQWSMWWDGLRRAAKDHTFYATVNMVLCHGEKPR